MGIEKLGLARLNAWLGFDPVESSYATEIKYSGTVITEYNGAPTEDLIFIPTGRSAGE